MMYLAARTFRAMSLTDRRSANGRIEGALTDIWIACAEMTESQVGHDAHAQAMNDIFWFEVDTDVSVRAGHIADVVLFPVRNAISATMKNPS